MCIFLITTLAHSTYPFSPPLWCIFNIPVIAEQPEMSHLGTPLFPLHLCLLFKDANSPSSSSSASLDSTGDANQCHLPRSCLSIPPAGGGDSAHSPPSPPSASSLMKSLLLEIPLVVSLARCLLQMINVECVNLRFR